MRLGAMPGDPRGMVDVELRAALIEAVQSNASELVWGWHREREGNQWLGREDGAGFVAEESGLVLVAARVADERAPAWAKLSTTSVGRAGRPRLPASQQLRIEGNVARRWLERGVEERWVHGPLGLEQVWVLSERPEGSGPIVIDVRIDGTLAPRLDGRGAVELVDSRGRVRGRYGELFVRDADGARLDARLLVVGRVVRVVLDDDEARYPVTVDPLVWMEQATLTASDKASDESVRL